MKRPSTSNHCGHSSCGGVCRNSAIARFARGCGRISAQAIDLRDRPADRPMPPAWCPYANCGSADEVAGKVVAAGGQLCHGPIDVPGGGRIVQFFDPQHAMFAVHSMPAAAPVKPERAKPATAKPTAAKPAASKPAKQKAPRRPAVKKRSAKRKAAKPTAKRARKVVRKPVRKPARKKAVRKNAAPRKPARRKPARKK